MQEIKKSLNNAKSIYNLIRLYGEYELLERLEFDKLNILYREALHHLNILNLKKRLEESSDSTNILNEALEDVIFMFDKVGEEELVLADELKDTLRKSREALGANFDQKDPEFIALKDELERLFKKKQLSEVSQEEMTKNIVSLNKILKSIRELNYKNRLLSDKYGGDNKYARIHKRLLERSKIDISNILPTKNSKILEALTAIKGRADEVVLKNSRVVENEGYFDTSMRRVVIDELKYRQKIALDAESTKYINNLVVKEYLNEYNGVNQW